MFKGFLVLFLFFLGFGVYNDFKLYGILNYSVPDKSSDVKWSQDRQEKTTIFNGHITAKDNYFGSITLHLYKLNDFDGIVKFKIKEQGQDKWIAENTYDFSYFMNSGHYTFGFPQITNSVNKQYEFILVYSPKYLPGPNSYVNLADNVSSKYVYNKETLKTNKQKLLTLLYHRTISAVKNLYFIRILIQTLLATAVWGIIISSPKNLSGIGKIKYLSSQLSRFNPFFVSGLLIGVIFIALSTSNIYLAEKASVWLFLSLVISVVWQLLVFIVNNYLEKLIRVADLLINFLMTAVKVITTKKVALIIGLIILIFSSLNNIYTLGGDDSRIFYIYPHEYLNNFATNISSNTGLSELIGFLPPRSILPFVSLMTFLKWIFPLANLQAVFYTLNNLLGLTFFYLLLKYLLKPQTKYDHTSIAIASFAYVYSIFNFYVLFNSKLLSIFLISIFPLTILLLLKSVKEAKLHFMALIAIIWSLFSLVAVSFPWSSAATLVVLPFLIIYLKGYLRRLLLYLGALFIFFIGLNLHWLIYTPFSGVVNKQINIFNEGISSQNFRSSTKEGVLASVQANNPFYPLLNLYHEQIQINNNWPQLQIFRSWYIPFLPLGLIFSLVLVWSGINVRKNKDLKKLYICASLTLLLCIYLFTVNIPPLGVDLFALLIDKIPGFVVFRNMFDKFAFPLSFAWALVIGVGLILIKNRFLLLIVFIVSLIWAKPYLMGEFDKLPVWTTKDSYNTITGLNKDYLDLVKFIKNQPGSGRYLSLPFQTGSSATVQDNKLPNHYYNGVSPLLPLTGKNDLTGLLSFGSQGQQIYTWLQNHRYEDIGKLISTLGVEYVIVNNQIPDDLKKSFIYSDGLYALQTSELVKELTGDNVQDFGQKYSLYKISPKYHSQKIYFTHIGNSSLDSNTNLSFTKKSLSDYEVFITNLKEPITVNFLEPYFNQWQMNSLSNKNVLNQYHDMVMGYANSWKVDPEIIKELVNKEDYSINNDGSLNVKLRIFFQPSKHAEVSLYISLIFYILLLTYTLFSIRKNNNGTIYQLS